MYMNSGFAVRHQCLNELKICNGVQNKTRSREGNGSMPSFLQLWQIFSILLSMAKVYSSLEMAWCPHPSLNSILLGLKVSQALKVPIFLSLSQFSHYKERDIFVICHLTSMQKTWSNSIIVSFDYLLRTFPTAFTKCKVRKAITFPVHHWMASDVTGSL